MNRDAKRLESAAGGALCVLIDVGDPYGSSRKPTRAKCRQPSREAGEAGRSWRLALVFMNNPG